MNYAETYDALYQTGYHAGPGFTHAAWCIEQIRRLYMAATILDVGCGPGVAVWQLHAMGFVAHGCDVSRIAVGRGKRGGVTGLKVASATDLPYDDASFDVVMTSDVLEHLTERDVPKAAAEMARVLRPGGHIIAQIATSLERNTAPVQRARAAGYNVPDRLHLTVRSTGWWSKELTTALGNDPATCQRFRVEEVPNGVRMVLQKR